MVSEAAKPIVGLANTAQDIGAGHLNTRADVFSNDEIGALSKSLNKMAENLQNTMASRDELIQEVDKRQKSEERLEILIRSLPVGIILVDSKTHEIVFANPKASLMFDAPFDHFVGSQCHNLICPQKKGKCPVTDLGQSLDNRECELLNAHREIVPIIKTIFPMDDNPFYDKIKSIRLQIDRMGSITKKLMRITRYETTDYLEGKIIDINKAAN